MAKTSKTKEYIQEALLKLLKTRKLADITVSDIVNTAGVARASFYRNYLDINELIDCCFEKYFDEIFSDIKVNDVHKFVSSNFKKIKENKEFFLIMKKQGLLYKINDIIYKKALLDINELNIFNNKYQPYFFAGASSFVIEAWIDNNFDEDEKTMTKIFFDSINGYKTK